MGGVGERESSQRNSMYKVQGGRGCSSLEVLREGQCGHSILSYREIAQNGVMAGKGQLKGV